MSQHTIGTACRNLNTLNDYAKRHEIGLLHLHLCGDEDDDYNPFQEDGFY